MRYFKSIIILKSCFLMKYARQPARLYLRSLWLITLDSHPALRELSLSDFLATLVPPVGAFSHAVLAWRFSMMTFLGLKMIH